MQFSPLNKIFLIKYKVDFCLEFFRHVLTAEANPKIVNQGILPGLDEDEQTGFQGFAYLSGEQ